MGKFDSAVIHFESTGHFSLKDATLTYSQLLYLQEQINSNQLHVTPPYKFILKNVVIFPDPNLRNLLTPPLDTQGNLPTLVIIDEEQEQEGDNAQETIATQDALCSEELKYELERLLYRILAAADNWDTIQLENIKFADKKNLTNPFISALLREFKDKLAIKVLSLKDTPINSELLAAMIKNNHGLQSLHLRPTTPLNNTSLQQLTTALHFHPSVEKLEFFVATSENLYRYLDQLLNNNYRIKEILLPQHQDQNLNKNHNKLLSRLRKDNVERFIQERLSQKALYQLARFSIFNNNPERLNVIFKEPNSLLSVCSNEEKTIDEIINSLPAVYKNYRNMMENLWQKTSLNVSVVLPKHEKSIGELLIREALETSNEKIINLVFAYVLPALKKNQELNKLLSQKLFDDTKNYACKNTIIKYFNQELSYFSEWVDTLTQYPNIQSGLNALHKHLCRHLSKLVTLHYQWYITKMLNPSFSHYTEKKIEWEKQFYDLIEGIQSAEKIEDTEDLNRGALRCKSFSELHDHIQKIIDRTDKKNLGFWNHTNFHMESFLICNELSNALKPYCINEEVNALKEDNRNLRQRVDEERAERDLRIRQLEETHAQEMNEMREQLREEIRTEVITEMDSRIQLIEQRLIERFENRGNVLVANEAPQARVPDFFS